MPAFQLDKSGTVEAVKALPITGTTKLADLDFCDLSPFAQAYIEALFFTESEGFGEWCNDGGADFFAEWAGGFSDLAPVTLALIIADCEAFETANAATLTAAYEAGCDDGSAYTASRAGHDFWLNRNGHGAGFWDRGLGELGDLLDAAARAVGSVEAYLGGDGKVYLS